MVLKTSAAEAYSVTRAWQTCAADRASTGIAIHGGAALRLASDDEMAEVRFVPLNGKDKIEPRGSERARRSKPDVAICWSDGTQTRANRLSSFQRAVLRWHEWF